MDPGRVVEPKLARVEMDRGDRRGAVPRGNMSRPTIRSIPNTGVAEAATVEEQVKPVGLAGLATMVAFSGRRLDAIAATRGVRQ